MKPNRDLQGERVNIKWLHSPRRRRLAFVAALALSWPLLAAADCTMRKPKAAEIDFNTRAMAALMATLPPAPAGVQMSEGKSYDFNKVPDVNEVLCDFSKEGAFSVTARRSYLRKHTEAERKYWDTQYEAVQTQAGALRKLPAEKVAQEKALRQQSNIAWQATRDAEKAGDKATAQARDAEYRALRNQADAIQNAHEASVKPQLDELNRRRTGIDLADQRVEIEIAMNLQRLPTANERTVVGSQGAASPGKSAGLRVNNVVWSVGGTDGSLRQALVAAIDRDHLQSLVGKPLPSAAESEAYAAKAVPVTVAELSAGAVPATPVTAASPAPTTAAASPTPPAPARQTVATAPTAAEPAAEPIKKAVDAVNMLRGLLGR